MEAQYQMQYRRPGQLMWNANVEVGVSWELVLQFAGAWRRKFPDYEIRVISWSDTRRIMLP